MLFTLNFHIGRLNIRNIFKTFEYKVSNLSIDRTHHTSFFLLYSKMTFVQAEFKTAVGGFHFYKKYWEPEESEEFECFHERNNRWDLFAIKTCQKGTNKTVGHLPMEILRATKFLMDRGATLRATVRATLTSTKYRVSPYRSRWSRNCL